MKKWMMRMWGAKAARDVEALWIAARDPRTPFLAKLVAGLTAAYALSPLDLIPDFIPILGLLDDAVIVPIGVFITIQLIPAPLMEEFRAKALVRKEKRKSFFGLALIIGIWLCLLAILIWLFWPNAAHGISGMHLPF